MAGAMSVWSGSSCTRMSPPLVGGLAMVQLSKMSPFAREAAVVKKEVLADPR